METINERIRSIVSELFNNNVSAFSRGTDIKQTTINDIVGGRLNKPSFDVISKIYNANTLNISLDWLINGEGDMLKSNTTEQNTEQSLDNEERLKLLNMLESQQRMLESFTEKLDSYQRTIESQQLSIVKLIEKKQDVLTGDDAECADVG